MNLKTFLFAGASALTLSAMNPAAMAQDGASEPMTEEADAAETDMTDTGETAEAADPQVLLAE